MSMNDFPSKDRICAVTIADSATESAAIDLGGLRPVLVSVPADFEGTQMTFKVATTLAGTYGDLRDSHNAIFSIVVTAGDVTRIDAKDALGLRYIKLVSDVAQVGDTDIELITFPF